MTTIDHGARHRAPRRTALAALAHQRAQHPGSGRGLAVLASSGLVVAVAATSATAAPADAPSLASAEGLTLTAAARAAVSTSPVVTVPADAEWSVAPIEASSKPAPPPPVVARAQSARSSARAATTATQATSSTAPAPAVSPSAIVNFARQFIGTPYVWGGTTPSGFDCSGFTQYVYRNFGIELPRTSSAQSGAGTRVSAADAQPGDLVWWPGHVGIYTGGGNHIAARSPGVPLTEGPLYGSGVVYIRVG